MQIGGEVLPASWDGASDVIVVGSGFAGFATAAAAASAGSAVIVVEKMPLLPRRLIS